MVIIIKDTIQKGYINPIDWRNMIHTMACICVTSEYALFWSCVMTIWKRRKVYGMKRRRKKRPCIICLHKGNKTAKKWLALALFANRAGSIHRAHIPPLRSTTSHSVPLPAYKGAIIKRENKKVRQWERTFAAILHAPNAWIRPAPRHCGQVWGSEKQKKNTDLITRTMQTVSAWCNQFSHAFSLPSPHSLIQFAWHNIYIYVKMWKEAPFCPLCHLM